jgi:hypothetical protein|tara:strand:+ start:1262 stop:2032 length:771 start_codon:yes stop_codon:yes gene_type:complete
MEEKVTKQKFKFPTETVELPSKGLLYPKDSTLSSGKIEMKYMTAKEEDILTNQNYISQGIVFDKLIESLIVSKINYNELLLGDKNALMVASRVLGYGKDYKFKSINPTTGLTSEYEIDLSTLKDKHLDPKNIKTEGVNEFEFTLPTSNTLVKYKLLTHGDETAIDKEIKGLQKINPDSNPAVSTRLKHMIISIDGNTDKKDIREFVDNFLLAKDARTFRDEIRKISPDVNLKHVGNEGEEVDIPINLNFFWPDAGI